MRCGGCLVVFGKSSEANSGALVPCYRGLVLRAPALSVFAMSDSATDWDWMCSSGGLLLLART